jgi:hypothetical protein
LLLCVLLSPTFTISLDEKYRSGADETGREAGMGILRSNSPRAQDPIQELRYVIITKNGAELTI